MDPDTIIIASCAISVALLILYGYLFLFEKKLPFLFWFVSILLLLTAYVSRLAIDKTVLHHSIFLIVNYISTVFGYWFIYKGIMTFFRKRSYWPWDIIPGVLTVLYITFTALQISITAVLILSAFYATALLIIAGFTTIQAEKPKRPIKQVLGCTFWVWSLFTLLYPLFNIQRIIPTYYGYLFVGILGLIALVGIQSLYYEVIKQELEQREINIRKLIVFDKLTGVYNRGYFEQSMDEFVKDFPVALVMGDVNGLKLINDTFGHEKGDGFLIDAVNIIKESIGIEHYIIRWGGDEFIIVMPKTNQDDAEAIIAKIKEHFKDHSHISIPNDISLGAAVVSGGSDSINEAINIAEERMYNRKLIESKDSRMAIINFLIELLCEKGGHSREHLSRLRSLVYKVGKSLNLSVRELDDLDQVAILHDIGKTGVPMEILLKEGNMTADEWKALKKHVEIGYRITQASRELSHISTAILSHHEWWDGTGYPQGLSGEDIPLYARIVSLVDAYEGMTHNRPNRPAVDSSTAMNRICAQAGIKYDPHLVDIFYRIINTDYSARQELEENITAC